jgi:glyoxylase-like metal-dependent hydrolase (beta-lactamase superfamily II)
MTVKLYAFTCGEITGDLGNFLDGENGKITVPVPAYLIDHPRGRLVFDTGLNRGLRQDASRLLGPLAKHYEISLPPSDDIASRLKALDVDPGSIRYLINSHLHFDHCGGNELVPNATVIVQRNEWKAAQVEEMQRAGAYSPHDFDHGHDIRQIDGEFDIYGDGLLVLFPTTGHTPGHQSLRVRLASGEIVLAADCCYFKRTLDARHLPPYAYRKEDMLVSLERIAALQANGARIFFGHDPEFWKTVPQSVAMM